MTTTAKWVSLIKSVALALLVAWVLVKLLRNTGMACVPVRCSADGFRYGAQLFAGGLALALVGRCFLTLPTRSVAAPLDAGLFRSLAVGLVVLIAYVYVRSLFNQFVVNLPVTRPEVLGLVLLSGAALVWAGRARETHPEPAARAHGLLTDLVLLFLLCVVMADRELPREVMLSSDPDVHVFFGIQVERFGGVPFHQRDWGSQDFNYPAGSAVVLFLWQMVSGLDPRNLLVVLPVLFSFVAALVVAEMAGSDLDRVGHRLVLKLAAVALTAAGFVFPLFKEYAHLEGAARQMSVLPVAVFLGVVVAYFQHRSVGVNERVVLPVLVVFALAALNPANVAIPGMLLGAMWVYGSLKGWRSLYLISVLLAALLLLVLEPYYHGLLGIAKQARIDTVVYDDRLIIKTLPQIVSGAWTSWVVDHPTILREFAVLFGEHRTPVFLSVFGVYLVGLVLVRRGGRLGRPGWLSLIAFAVALFLVYGFARSLLDDRRFFLLGPYIFFNMTQYKAMLLVLMLAFILKPLVRAPWVGVGLAGVVSVALVLPVMYLVRSEQGLHLEPRKTYCGVYGCLADSDRRLLETFEQQVRQGRFPPQDGITPKVLMPNAFKQTEHEAWILPVSSARVLPYYDVLPAAFYYYQGDLEYGTSNYKAHVCERLDRAWLKARHIHYLYLPSGRENACVDGMAQLIESEEVVLREGDAYLLRFR
jgi:hypothetical protein